MKTKTITTLVIVGLIIGLSSYGLFKSATGPGEYDNLANCLTNKGIKMYGTDWCSHCKDQKVLFGKSFKKVDYVNCDTRKQDCRDAGVSGYPTWIINGEQYSGTQSLSELARLSECTLG
jgi:glutaredoxin|tara:strand:+ start:574 stop:930 length:357 start_codon:yes stop_codon:yes gene_type:complete